MLPRPLKASPGAAPKGDGTLGQGAFSLTGKLPEDARNNYAQGKKAAQPGAQAAQPVEPVIGVARYLVWVLLVLVLGLALFLSLMIGRSAREVMLEKQYAFASLLAENLNHQIYRRYTLPTLIGYGRIALNQPVQYERLDQLIGQLIHGMNVQELRIYDHSQVISYTTNQANLGRNDLASPAVVLAMTSTEPIFDLDTQQPWWKSFFMPRLEEGSIILRTTYPLRIENRLTSSEEEGPVMGVLEFRQDITKDMVSVLRFQWSIIGTTLVSSLLIFSLLIYLLYRADRALAARVEERDKLQEKLYQHEKLAGMGRVVAGIAHEIRNPLGIICSSAELLLRRVKNLDESSRGILQAIFDESKRLSKTVTDFLDYARPRSPRQDMVDMGKVVEQAAIFMHPELERHGISLHLMLPEPPVFVIGDKDLLYRAIYNVLGNAVQALSISGVGAACKQADPTARGEIWADVAYCAPAEEKMPVGLDVFNGEGMVSLGEVPMPTPEPHEACIVIRDNGPGFDLEDTRTYMDPFFTTKASGSGLGLAIVHSIIGSHKGRLELSNYNGPGSGAVVKVFLPSSK